jgi:hypothetical protein
MPSNVATEAQRQSRDDEDDDDDDDEGDGDGKESAIETMTSRVERVVQRDAAVPRPQSKVPTDAHDSFPPLVGYEPAEPDDLGDPFDPDRTKELEKGSIKLGDDTQDLPRHELGALLGKVDGEEPR